jgi:NAD(P)H-dependent FMN reductase
MKNILAFGASSSANSINKAFANYSSKQIPNSVTNLLDLNDFEMPIFSIDKQNANGIPDEAQNFKKHISNSDAIIISFAEHNGSYTSAFKNILDWVSRIERIVWCGKPMLLLSVSDGERGAKLVLETAFNRIKRENTETLFKFSLKNFHTTFDFEKGILDTHLNKVYRSVLADFIKVI